MSLTHPGDLETIHSVYYQNFHSFDGDISELGLNFSDSLCCPICGKNEKFSLLTNNADQSDILVTEKNKVRNKLIIAILVWLHY